MVGRERKGRVAGDDEIEAEIGDRDGGGIAYLEWESKSALASLLFRLQGVNLPVGSVAQNHFVADVVFAGEFVNTAAGGSVRNVEAGLRECAGRPDVDECSATAVGDPEAWILGGPAAGCFLDGGVRGLVE